MASRLRRSSRSSRSDEEDEEKFMSKSSGGFSPPKAEYFGWVYHLGVNKIGREYCHLRFLRVRGKYVEMYKRDPHEHPGVRPIRQGTMGHTLMVEEQGRRRVHNGDLYVIRFYNRLDESGKGEIACSTAGEAQKWMEAFDQAKQQADYELSRAKDAREKLNVENEINLEGHRRRVRKYAQELRRFTRIGSGPETLLNKPPGFCCNDRSGDYIETDGDVIEAHRWRCVWTLRGIRIFEDIADSKEQARGFIGHNLLVLWDRGMGGKHVLVKSVGVIDASADTLFEVLMSLDPSTRYEWDVLTGDLELIESLNGHYDVLYGTYDTKYFTRWKSKKDFVFSRQWFCAQDGTYTHATSRTHGSMPLGQAYGSMPCLVDTLKSILHFPSGHRKKPTRSGYQRTKVNPSTWEIKNLTGLPASQSPKCLLTLMLEIKSSSWNKWKKSRNSKFETSFPFALLCLVAGVKEYVAANPSLISKCHSTVVDPEGSYNSFDSDMSDDFHDAKTIETLSDSEDSDEEIEVSKQDREGKLKDRPRSTRSLMLEKTSGLKHELDSTVPPFPIDTKQFHSSLPQEKDTDDKNCWSDPGGIGFMVRGKTYLKDNAKVKGGDPLLKLIAVDWLRAEKSPDNAALRPSCAVQSDTGRKLPFIFVINLQIPAKPNYSMILYFAANRPVKKDSLLGKFIDGTDMFRDSRFKLIPSIVKGYWMVKKAVGTKACLLGKAVTCRYLRQDNFLEIDVDIGSSSVARGVINLVLGHVTSLVVDLAILLEANEESELPEYLLGTVRLNSISPSSAEQV